ncbi:MAG: hypothetical protein LPK79_05620, partial [Bacteroidota bacterium]|nr:hypothetical protein [Bacteroidota bacterium]
MAYWVNGNKGNYMTLNFRTYPFPTPLRDSGYAFIIVNINNQLRGCTSEARFFIRTFLNAGLTKGDEYVIEFHYRSSILNKFEIEYFGCRLDSILEDYTKPSVWSLAPTLNWHRKFTEEASWIKLKGSFIATGKEKYLTLGNFRSDYHPITRNTAFDSLAWDSIRVCYPFILIDGVFLYKATDTLFTTGLNTEEVICQGDSILLSAVPQGFKLEDTVTT